MSLYYEAAALLANTENTGGSLKSRLFTKRDLKSSPGQIFALIAEASKWSLVLKDVIENCSLLAEEKKLTPILALLLTHDLLVARSGVAAPASHVLKLAITRHKARLSAEFTKARIRYGYPTLRAFKDAIDNGELEGDEDAAQKATRHPRWVRVNTIKTSLEQQLATTFSGFRKTDNLAEVLSSRGNAKIYYEDPNIPSLLALPSKINLSRCNAYTKGEIIFQDKASCFPAYLLDLSPDDGDVIDGCAAPGNKTTHLAAIVSNQDGASENQRVIAFERDKVRTGTLQKMVKLVSADKIVSVKGGSDFLAAKPGSDEFANVGAILLDPSCSGTGIVGRDDGIKIHLPSAQPGKTVLQSTTRGKKRKRGDDASNTGESAVLDVDVHDSAPEETPYEGKVAERLATLSNFQLHILTHAMRFSLAHKITYSTCSIHFEENEGVVFQALASSIAKERGWKILKRERQVSGLQSWSRRGVWEDDKVNVAISDIHKQDVLDGCIRCDKGTNEGTMGFFVAAFVRDSDESPDAMQEALVVEEDEWNGFSDADECQDKSTVSAAPAKALEKNKKRKKRKASAADLSRLRLTALAKWIRDDLDVLVAREGPNVLRPDDVLTLHETLIGLRLSQHITAMDLRATGIHMAVQDIAGVATRWPGRLCDDCDKIIALWTAKFGPFNQLHPFLYGRGGRLEGIASVNEYSRESQTLLKRWSETCPEKIHRKRSHRLGALGFKAGDWWINTLFAHHAGIIGLEAVEGGTTFDKHDAIRILRSHSFNSVWGPKAGVRYEGLYGVKSWSIRQAKTTDTAGGEWKQGDIIFEVRFERRDDTPMEEVTRRPTATEVDDYSEYKRLRKLQREGKRKIADAVTNPIDMEFSFTKAAPPIIPPQPSGATGGAIMVRPGMVSPRTIPNTDHFPMMRGKANTLIVPSNSNHRNLGDDFFPSGSPRKSSPDTNSRPNSTHTAASTQPNILEVAPWIDFDAGLTVPSLDAEFPIIRQKIIPRANDPKAKDQPIARNASNFAPDSPPPSSRRDGRKSGDFKDFKGFTGRGYLSPSGSSKMRDGRKSIFVRSRNPMAKLFDGAASKDDEASQTITSTKRSEDRASNDSAIVLHSPVPQRPFSPDMPLAMARRGALLTTTRIAPVTLPMLPRTSPHESGNGLYTLSPHDPFVDSDINAESKSDALLKRFSVALPISLKMFMGPPRNLVALPKTGDMCRRLSVHGAVDAGKLEQVEGGNGNVTFTNPFGPMEEGKRPRLRRESSENIAPDVVG
ncbi:hypothetical protein EK21DRAFT_74691 [Setomelanomma holmii]|uniref:SAM-dependent MTase RsmB/NOP-type domain-containing protein n=1 Tax=Setomelanomma holmii TaxID=210430 RepID=A0A9P4LI86_9PLEO|nr:hypothetical protein EK21DRAFT_74691 [Setomelanomma holmii]